MEGFGNLGFGNLSSTTTKKKRSNTSRRLYNDPRIPDVLDGSSLPSTPPSENNENKAVESDEGSSNSSFQGSTGDKHTGTGSSRCPEGFLAPVNRNSSNRLCSIGTGTDVPGKENSVKVVKLKVGGVIRTIDATSVSDGASGIRSSSTKSSHISDAIHLRQKNQDNSDEPSITSDKLNKLGILYKGFSGSDLSTGKANSLKHRVRYEDLSIKQTDSFQPLRKSKRLSTQCVVGEGLDDADDGEAVDEIRCLEKVKTTKFNTVFDDEEEGKNRKHRKLSKVMKQDFDYPPHASARLIKQGKKKQRGDKLYDDADYVEEEEEMISDREPERKRLSKSRNLSCGSRNEMTVTTRQRATQTGKDFSYRNLEEFSSGLPPAAPRKQKDKLSEMEQQLKRAEAAQRRRMQVEKAARESEAEAIRKILGQDSVRKKREEKIKRLQEEKAKERAATSVALQPHTVKWVMRPSGTVVTFPDEVGLPNIFESKPLSYPPPREKCAGPSCKNPYKYRDSKSKLPLCSLQCYKALQGNIGVSGAC